MAKSNKNLGYNTHILGTVKSVNDCLGIILYNEKTFDSRFGRISLYNIADVYKYIIEQADPSEYVKLTRETSLDPFKYIRRKDNSGFDTIIYISNLDNSAIGYTEFLNTQGRDRDINLTPQITESLEQGNVEIINSLAQLRTTESVENKDIGLESWEFTDIQKVLGEKKIEEERYTTSTSQAKRDGIILNSLGAVYTKSENPVFKPLSLTMGGVVNLYKNDFTDRNLGYYMGDLSLYSWFVDDSGKYCFCVTSMTKLNKFGNPIVYIKSGTGYNRIEQNNISILYGAGRYLVVKENLEGTSVNKLYDFEKQELISFPYPKLLIDPMSKTSRVYNFPKILTKSALFEYIPEIGSVYMDIRKYSKINTPDLYRKIGNWYILRKRVGTGYIYICAGIGSTLYMTESEFPGAMFLNDYTVIIKYSSYYLLYSGINKEMWTEEYKNLVGKGEIKKDIISGVSIYFDGTKSEDELKEDFSGRIAFFSDSLKDTFFNNYRRGAYPINIEGLPNIIAGGDGVIFYKTGYNINYL